ncbi:MAG TPA: sugar ABC transporter permease [Thermoleophilaceae bacterium]|jgi:multiple sugar transport system permease protein
MSAEPAAPRRTFAQRVLGEHPTAWAFVFPAMVIIVGLAVVPIGWSLLLSFNSADLIAPAKWVGLSNYDALMRDDALRDAIRHTVIYTVLFVPISVALGLFLAMGLNRKLRLIGLYRTAIMAPYIAAVAAQGVLFSFIFDQRFGVANALLDEVGLPRQGFLGDPDQALYVIVLIGIWGGIGFPLVIYLAALQDVPRELLDAAAVDGSRRWATFWHVTMPQLTPVTIFLVVWQTLLSLQLFDLVYATTRGGPLDSTVVIVYYIYNQAFELFHAGYAAAVAYVVAVFLMVMVGAQLVYSRWRTRHA